MNEGLKGIMIPYNLIVLIITLIGFGVTIVSFSIDRLSKYYVPIAIISTTLIGILYTPMIPDSVQPDDVFTSFIEFRAIIFIFSMQIIVTIIEKERIFQYLAVHLIRVTKGNPRVLFYMFCIITTLFATIIADVTVSIIFAPLIIKISRILEIKAGPYLLGMTININLGSLITPFSSSENIIISTDQGLNLDYFISHLWLFFVVVLFLTIFLIDITMIKGKQKVDKRDQETLLKILTPDVVIDRDHVRRFYFNLFLTVLVFSLIIIIPESFIGALIGAILLIVMNKKQFTEVVKEI
ncbi:MAG: SLC13 family permease, partial [Promethearchaeota archaeon]